MINFLIWYDVLVSHLINKLIFWKNGWLENDLKGKYEL